jgi:Uma2 family endonuclease
MSVGPSRSVSLWYDWRSGSSLAGIPEVWVVILSRDVVEVYTNPVGGDYSEQREARPGDSIGASLIPSLVIEVSAIVGR